MSVMASAAHEKLGIRSLKSFQYIGAQHYAFNDNITLLVNQKTGEGKTIVPQLVDVLRRGNVVNLVPLIGLGTDQVEPQSQILSQRRAQRR